MAALKWRDWGQLVRAPNLFTVPGDPLAGYLLVASAFHSFALAAIVASVCFYIYGLLCNDLFDLAEDQRERPDRPLPSHAAAVKPVGRVAAGCALVAIGVSFSGGLVAGMIGVALAGSILLYDVWLKKMPLVGAANMGACRGLSGLLGAAFAGPMNQPALLAAMLTALYVAAVTNLARHETQPTVPRSALWFPLGVLITGSLIFMKETPTVLLLALILLLAVLSVGLATRSAFRGAALPPVIGAMIRGLLPLQAAYCVYAGSAVAAVLLLALWPLSRLVAARFYAS
jgi:UbiA prenyltransferase family